MSLISPLARVLAPRIAWRSAEVKKSSRLNPEKTLCQSLFSADGPVEPTGVVFAGYGLRISNIDTGSGSTSDGRKITDHDSYVHLNVIDQWVMVFRDLPQDIAPELRQKMARYSSPRRKATIARLEIRSIS
ncbi:MAG: hypothetical protein AAF664_02610 [Planctomycetota bacterium]